MGKRLADFTVAVVPWCAVAYLAVTGRWVTAVVGAGLMTGVPAFEAYTNRRTDKKDEV